MSVANKQMSCCKGEVARVQFGILNPAEIKGMSVTPEGISFAEFCDNGRAKIGGLMDPRQGPIDRDTRCLTCAKNNSECPGHFGHIELVRPVYHVGFMKYILKILRCVCFHCSLPLVDPSQPPAKHIVRATRNNRRARFEQMYKLCSKSSVCGISKETSGLSRGGCGRRQPKYLRNGLELYITSRKKGDSHEEFADLVEMEEADINASDGRLPLFPDQVYRILKAISDDTCNVLGLDPNYGRPEWMVLTNIPVPPLAVRPSVIIQGTSVSQDDLTHKLYDIVTANRELNRLLMVGAPQHVVEDQHRMLQYHVSTLIDNEVPGVPTAKHKNGRPLKAIKMRLKGKEGRIRGNLMGKRVDFSARTVITPDPNIRIDEVGVPLSIAMKLTYPEKVTLLNRDRLMEMVIRGPGAYPGAKYLIKRDRTVRCDLYYAQNRQAIQLRVGDVLERHLIDGDWIVFNRQPSLHKMSMMAHRVRVMPFSTFRLNLSVTTPYNADFDGDEMNLHVPQTEAAIAELTELMTVQRMIVTPQSNRPVMGIVQDTLTAARMLTKRNTFLTRTEFMNALARLPYFTGEIPPPCILKPQRLWSGKQLFSMIIPGRVNCTRTNATHNDDEDCGPLKWISPSDTRVLVENGKLLSGILCKKTLGTSPGSLIHVIFNELGHAVTGEFFYHAQLVINGWLMRHSFTIGVSDTIADGATYGIIQNHIKNSKDEVAAVIKKAQSHNLERLPGCSLKQTFESTVNRLLNQGRDVTGRSAQGSLSDRNNFKAMVIAGSKGSDINISQVIACVGQQNVEGQRIPFGFKRRTLPHFMRDDFGPESKGFVENSYLQGLTPTELFFHAMGGREGLIDTAVKTAETGYIQRRLMKTMESISVNYDGTVRNQTNQLIQVCYGEDGVDGIAAENQTIPLLSASQFVFEREWQLKYQDIDELRRYMNEEIAVDINSSEFVQASLDEEWNQLVSDRKFLRDKFTDTGGRFVLPLNIERIIWNAQKLFKIDPRHKVDIHPMHIMDSVKTLCQKFKSVPGNDDISKQIQENSTVLVSILLRCYLSTKKVIYGHKLSMEAFDWVIDEAYRRYCFSLVQPGEMVGALSAQSLGEPATQMTLNTFHYAGVSAKNVTLGVPRLKEIINVSENQKTPSMTVFLTPDVANDPDKTRAVLNTIEYCTLKDVVRHSAIYYDPDFYKSVIAEDADWQAIYYHTLVYELPSMSPWVLRMELDEKQLANFGLDAEFVGAKIEAAFGDDLFVELNTECDASSIIRVRVVNRESSSTGEAVEDEKVQKAGEKNKMSDEAFLRCVEANLMNELCLKGIPKIKKVYMQKPSADTKKRMVINDKGEIDYKSEWVLETDGSALGTVLSVDGVDRFRTYSNDVWEVYRTLGVEAARRAIEREIHQVISFDGSYVNRRHLALVCDVMTHPGFLVPITRHGIGKQDFGPLTRCTFEQSADILIEAGALCQTDHLKGISENIMLGKMARAGTGSFECLLNHQMLPQARPVKDPQAIKEEIVAQNNDVMFKIKSPRFVPSTPRAFSCQTPFGDDESTATMASNYLTPIAFSPAMTERNHGGANKDSPLMGHSLTGPGSTLTTGGPDTLFAPLDYGSMYSPALGAGGLSTFGGAGGSSTMRGITGSVSPGISTYMPSSPPLSAKPPSTRIGSPLMSSSSSAASSPSRSSKRVASPSYSPSSPSYSPGSPTLTSSGNRSRPSSPRLPESPRRHIESPLTTPNNNYNNATAVQRKRHISRAYSPLTSSTIKPGPSSPPTMKPGSPRYSLNSPRYSPNSPKYSPCSPGYTPRFRSLKLAAEPADPAAAATNNNDPKYSPKMPKATPDSPKYSPSSPKYVSPLSPRGGKPVAKKQPNLAKASTTVDSNDPPSKKHKAGYEPSSKRVVEKGSGEGLDERELFLASSKKKKSTTH